MRYRVLIVDDEADSRDALAELTQGWGYDVQTASDGSEALRRAIEWHPDVLLTDLVMPNMDGLWLLRALRAELPDCPVVLLTGRGTIQTAVQAIKEGAYDFIEKPLEVPRLRIVLERALEKKETMREVQLLRRRMRRPISYASFAADSAATWPANGVFLREPLKPIFPAEAHERVFPCGSVRVT